MTGEELTVCTSTFDDREYLKLNLELSEAINPNNKSRWIVIDNNPRARESLKAFFPNMDVYKGFEMDYSKIRAESYHHALALIKAIRLVKTRYALLLDPDFYIVKKNWISNILDYMKKKELTFFGAPWNPKYFTKYRYFPNVNCMFIDLEKINKYSLDFRPGTDDYILRRDSLLLTKIIKYFDNHLINYEYQRRSIGASHDTGYYVYYHYAHKKQFKYECVIPVFRKPKSLERLFRKIQNRLLIDRLSLIPKKQDSYTSIGFHELGFINVNVHGWEEYMWRNEPFSLHVRKAKKGAIKYEHQMDNLIEALNNLTGIKISNI